MKNDFPIDFIIPWVDGSDPEWLSEFNKYAPESSRKNISDSRAERYRDYGLLRYWFRGVEKFAPWVNKVHFVTSGQKPSWLNLDAPKLHWVRHSDYIPAEYLPVFSSHPIELMMHKIPNLAEHFIYFNDDIFLTAPVKREFFFKNGLPCDAAVENALSARDVAHIELNDLTILGKHFSKHRTILKNIPKWFSVKYGALALRTLVLFPWPQFTGFVDFHFAMPYRKAILEEIWQFEQPALEHTMENRFRNIGDVNQWLFRYWQLCKGAFYPVNPYRRRLFLNLSADISFIERTIRKQLVSELVLNDSLCTDYDQRIMTVMNAFEYILPEKSSFEVE